MTTIAYPTTRLFDPAEFQFWPVENMRMSRSPMTGAVQTVSVPGCRWNAIVTLRGGTPAEGATREAWIASLRSGINRVSMWHLARPEPIGTMRGSPTLSASVSAGASAVSIAGSGTLKAGDMIGVNGELLMVTADATLPGAVSFIPPLRAQAASGTSVVWSKPSTLFRLTAPVQARYEVMWSPSVQLQLEEVYP